MLLSLRYRNSAARSSQVKKSDRCLKRLHETADKELANVRLAGAIALRAETQQRFKTRLLGAATAALGIAR